MEPKQLVIDLLGAGWTQVRIAERTGITQTTVSKILHGQVKDVLSARYRLLLAAHAEAFPKRRKATA